MFATADKIETVDATVSNTALLEKTISQLSQHTAKRATLAIAAAKQFYAIGVTATPTMRPAAPYETALTNGHAVVDKWEVVALMPDGEHYAAFRKSCIAGLDVPMRKAMESSEIENPKKPAPEASAHQWDKYNLDVFACLAAREERHKAKHRALSRINDVLKVVRAEIIKIARENMIFELAQENHTHAVAEMIVGIKTIKKPELTALETRIEALDKFATAMLAKYSEGTPVDDAALKLAKALQIALGKL